MSKVKTALTRKWGPLPAWGWFVGAFVALYFYRKYHSTSTVYSGTGTGSVAPGGPPPQAQTVLSPGESVYDPNTGALSTAPGGGGADTTAATDLGAAMDNLAGAIATGMPPTDVHVTLPSAPSTGKTSTGGSKNGSHKTNKRTPKTKDKHKHNKASKHPNPAHKPVGRSGANTRSSNGGRKRSIMSHILPKIYSAPTHDKTSTPGSLPKIAPTHGKTSTPGPSRSTQGPPAPSRARQRPKTPPVSTVTQQRQPATHPAPQPSKHGAAPSHRPSAPPPRTQRAPGRKKGK